MLRIARFVGALIVTALATLNPATSKSQPLEAELRLIDLYQNFKDAVVKVKIAIQTTDANGDTKVSLTVMTGFYIDSEGTVLTNAVPMEPGPRMRIEHKATQFLAVPIASDPVTNLALLRVAQPPEKIDYIDINASNDSPEIGSIAYAISSPLNLDPTPKLGLVTGRESNFNEVAFPFTYTRVSIPSGPAEGGSPFFDSEGKLIGISVAALPDVDSSYIIPADQLAKIVEQLQSEKSVSHPLIRASFLEQGGQEFGKRSIIVTGLAAESNAEKSDLRVGDKIIQAQDTTLESINQFRDLIAELQPGNFIRLTIERGNQELEIPILLEKRN
ncbi:S1C family serine protease [Pelagicoccus albus]|uniref:Serine protease n=1 Tax=Pelagicoccus albus TaxID=415222 RepID=A0A7X1B707_9BACT|nr:S1C family serine protease [Pelagicoccus albus]MBC2606836.1 serine protease [Pelagicoccus albus]